MTKRILVYGTLRREGGAVHLLGEAAFVEEVRIPGYDMYALSWFPGIKANPDNKEGIVGEVFELAKEEDIETLDDYEGYRPDNLAASLYLRKEIEVLGKPTFVYEYNRDTTPYPKVNGGDWTAKGDAS